MTKHGTAISWTHWPGTKGETWTVVRGCQLAKADGKPFKTCVNCYAMTQAHGLVERGWDKPGHYAGLTKMTSGGPLWTGEIRFDEEQLAWPLRCSKPRTFFLTSMGDLCYERVTDEQIIRVLRVALRAKQHRFLILTKRPDRMADIARTWSPLIMGLPENIWWGTSIEDQRTAEWAIPHLQKIGSANRWISYEPMIEYAGLSNYLPALRWVVIGGDSKQRKKEPWPFSVDAAKRVIADCRAAGVAAYVKQLGANPVQIPPLHLSKCDGHNANPEYWPEALRVQEFPK